MQEVTPYNHEEEPKRKERKEDEGMSLKAKLGYSVLGAIGLTGLIIFITKTVKKKIANKSDSKSFDDGTPETTAKQIKMAFENDGYFGTDTKSLREILVKVKSKAELELVRKAYQKQFDTPMYSDMSKELQSSEYKEMLQIMEGKAEKTGQPLTVKQYTAWAKRLKAAFEKTYSFIPGTDEPAIRAVFNEVPTQTAFINVGRAYKKEYNANLMDDLKSELEYWEFPEFMQLIIKKPKV